MAPSGAARQIRPTRPISSPGSLAVKDSNITTHFFLKLATTPPMKGV